MKYTGPVDEGYDDLQEFSPEQDLADRMAEAVDGAIQAVHIYGGEFSGHDHDAFVLLVKEGL